MSKTVGILHTTPVTIAALNELAKELLPGNRIINVLDDSLLPDVINAGHVTPPVAHRMVALAGALQEAGADFILIACSSVGGVESLLKSLLTVPVMRIDQAMAQTAVKGGTRIGVIATVNSTLEPTALLLEAEAKQMQKEIIVQRHLCHEAYEALISGDSERHNLIIKENLLQLFEKDLDVIVLAQASMARVVSQLPPPPMPVLSSPRLGLERLKTLL